MTEFERAIEEGLRSAEPVAPGGWISAEGDCAFFFNEDVPYSRERVDELLTVYRALDNGRIVGAQVKGLALLPRHDGIGVKVQSSPTVASVTVMLLKAAMARHRDPTEIDRAAARYAEVVDAFRGNLVDA